MPGDPYGPGRERLVAPLAPPPVRADRALDPLPGPVIQPPIQEVGGRREKLVPVGSQPIRGGARAGGGRPLPPGPGPQARGAPASDGGAGPASACPPEGGKLPIREDPAPLQGAPLPLVLRGVAGDEEVPHDDARHGLEEPHDEGQGGDRLDHGEQARGDAVWVEVRARGPEEQEQGQHGGHVLRGGADATLK